jgi:hypothetical protein
MYECNDGQLGEVEDPGKTGFVFFHFEKILKNYFIEDFYSVGNG